VIDIDVNEFIKFFCKSTSTKNFSLARVWPRMGDRYAGTQHPHE